MFSSAVLQLPVSGKKKETNPERKKKISEFNMTSSPILKQQRIIWLKECYEFLVRLRPGTVTYKMDKANAQICLWQQHKCRIKFDITPKYLLASRVWMSKEKEIIYENIDVLLQHVRVTGVERGRIVTEFP